MIRARVIEYNGKKCLLASGLGWLGGSVVVRHNEEKGLFGFRGV